MNEFFTNEDGSVLVALSRLELEALADCLDRAQRSFLPDVPTRVLERLQRCTRVVRVDDAPKRAPLSSVPAPPWRSGPAWPYPPCESCGGLVSRNGAGVASCGECGLVL